MRIEPTGDRDAESGGTIDRIIISIEPKGDVDAEKRRQDRVVIAAAMAALFGSPTAIRRIRTAPGHGAGAWNREGRRAVQRSHVMPAALMGQGRDRGEGKA